MKYITSYESYELRVKALFSGSADQFVRELSLPPCHELTVPLPSLSPTLAWGAGNIKDGVTKNGLTLSPMWDGIEQILLGF